MLHYSIYTYYSIFYLLAFMIIFEHTVSALYYMDIHFILITNVDLRNNCTLLFFRELQRNWRQDAKNAICISLLIR